MPAGAFRLVLNTGGEELDMGDLEFIQKKVLAGDYFQVSGDINTPNSTIQYIPLNGKTAFLIEAKIIPTTHPDPPTIPISPDPSDVTIVDNRVQAELLINGITKDIANVGIVLSAAGFDSGSINQNISGGASGAGNQNSDRFNVLGLSLVGNSTKKIEIKNVLDDGFAFATMSGYLIDT